MVEAVTSKNTTVTWVSPALPALMAWIEAQPPEMRERLTLNRDIARAWAAAWSACEAAHEAGPERQPREGEGANRE